LLLVIASVSLASLAQYGFISYSFNGGFSWQTKASVILGFLSATAFITTVALVIYRKLELSKLSLIIGLVTLVLMMAIRASTYF
jgi:hypothetical protein